MQRAATYQGLLKEQMHDLEDRLYTAPYAAEPFFVPDEVQSSSAAAD